MIVPKSAAPVADPSIALSVEEKFKIEPDKPDIEHVQVEDDPRAWSTARKNLVLFIVASASLIAGLAANIYNPAITKIEADLHTSSGQISLSLSLFILLQGSVPLIWTAISEIEGRKIVYLLSILISIVGCIVAAEAKSIEVLIAARCLQAIGSSAVISIGAATLADIYDPSERGTMMGVYYAAPLLGPALGPIIGGVLTQVLSWRATFWFLVIFMSMCLALFALFFKDTFRRERSLTYQTVLHHHQARAALEASKRSSTSTIVEALGEVKDGDVKSEKEDLESANPGPRPHPIKEVRLKLTDVNPFPPLLLVLRRWNNLATLTASGFIYGFSYCISYTCARTLELKYNYNALQTGLVLLSYGVGSIGGSILGGRWSDHVLKKLRAAHDGQGPPELRLQSIKPVMFLLPLPVIAYAWLAQEHVHVASLCAALFFAGFFSIWIYSSTLAYIVDANMGRSSAAVATNSCFRGTTAFLFAEVAVPLQGSIGDGGLYTLWTGLLVLCELLLLLVLYKGGMWREKAEVREREAAESEDSAMAVKK
ncbi:MFS general substrate transporter [Artomyces pyxidatus]|uniref:MFS general substrate transporter n=1 Tax=Artomyces pyxidatus TaxID=48021 RepID=A0ACB8T163_9AGAM|nr:MFS general substrate transporter [Artomyces pyxidatus]